MVVWERFAPSYAGKGAFASIMRLTGVIGITAGFLAFYSRSTCSFLDSSEFCSLLTNLLVRFYGFSENQREREMDMREMVDKVKRNEPLYGTSTLSPHMQGVAARNSRYAGVFYHILPWFNFVNHEQVRLLPFRNTKHLLNSRSTVLTRSNIINKLNGSSKRSGTEPNECVAILMDWLSTLFRIPTINYSKDPLVISRFSPSTAWFTVLVVSTVWRISCGGHFCGCIHRNRRNFWIQLTAFFNFWIRSCIQLGSVCFSVFRNPTFLVLLDVESTQQHDGFFT